MHLFGDPRPTQRSNYQVKTQVKFIMLRETKSILLIQSGNPMYNNTHPDIHIYTHRDNQHISYDTCALTISRRPPSSPENIPIPCPLQKQNIIPSSKNPRRADIGQTLAHRRGPQLLL